jgi:hypothetical protein
MMDKERIAALVSGWEDSSRVPDGTLTALKRTKRPTLASLLTRPELNSHNTKLGKQGQNITIQTLKANGFDSVWPIATPFVAIYGKDRATGKRIIEKLVYDEKAPGDIWCMKKGQMVLVEVKTSTKDRISWNALEDHQVANLNDQVKNGGMGILSVVLNDKAHLCVWPVAGFGPGHSIVLRPDGIGVE